MTTVADLLPANAQYDFDPATNMATITIETRGSKPGAVTYATIHARLSVHVDSMGDASLVAEYVRHEGDATQTEIGYACGVIETNDFGIQMER